MKNIYTLILLTLLFASCGKGKNKSVESIIESNDLAAIRNKKVEIVSKQKEINGQLKQLDEAIANLDIIKKVPLITTFKVNDTVFNHYLELQGSVTTKDLLVIYPEFSGTLTNVYVKEGQTVQKGQLLAKIDDGGLGQQLGQLQIQYELAKTTFDRQQRLWNQKIGSELQFLQAQSNFQAQAKAVSQLQKQMEKTSVRAPFSGSIDDVMTEQGSVVAAGQSSLMRIINLGNMYIETEVPEKYINYISKNKIVQVEFPVLDKSMISKVRQVGSYINPANRTFKIEISIPNKEKNIKPNLTARLKINDYTNKNALLIPQSIISENAKEEQYVFVIKGDGKTTAEKVFVKTGKTQGNFIEILSGLKNGDEIISEGARSVIDGQAVKILNQ